MNSPILRPIPRAPSGEGESGGESSATGAMAHARQAIGSTAREAAARLKSTASDTTARAKAEVQRRAADTKENAANRLGGYGSAIHDSAKAVEEQDPNLAWATHRVADGIQGLADYVRSRDFNQLRADAEDLARRHPLAFFGGLFIAGVVVGNLLKAHAPAEDREEGDEGGNKALAPTSMSDPAFPSGI